MNMLKKLLVVFAAMTMPSLVMAQPANPAPAPLTKEVAAPVVATRPEFMRRMKDMGAAGGGMTAFYAQMPDEVTLTINGNHPIYQTLLKESNVDLQSKQIRNLADLALLSQGLLKGAELTSFINRSVSLMEV
jgi:molecular chaperone HtpG